MPANTARERVIDAQKELHLSPALRSRIFAFCPLSTFVAVFTLSTSAKEYTHLDHHVNAIICTRQRLQGSPVSTASYGIREVQDSDLEADL